MTAMTLVRTSPQRRTQVTNRLARLRGLTIPQWSLLRRPVPRAVPVGDVGRPIQVKVASTGAEWEAAFRLVEENYEAHGYEAQQAGEYRFTPYHALPGTTVLVAVEQGRVLATLSLILDNTLLGLPAETLYPAEVHDLRQQGRHLWELGNLADRGLGQREFLPVFLTLVQLAVQLGLRQGGDTALITSTTRHGVFYRKLMGFVPLGPARPYSYVQNTLAQGYWLDVPTLKANMPATHARLLGAALAPEALVSCRVPPHQVLRLAARSSKSPRCIREILHLVQRHGDPRRW